MQKSTLNFKPHAIIVEMNFFKMKSQLAKAPANDLLKTSQRNGFLQGMDFAGEVMAFSVQLS
jgi:hypothetical protein